MELSLKDDGALSDSEWEDSYQGILKQFLTFLYSHPKIPFAFSFTGPQLEFLQSSHPEAIEILGEITSRKQGEVLGGGFYTPAFPLLFPVDRSGQIEKMNAAVRTYVGKKPRGMTVLKSIWEPALIITCQSCGIEYILLDSTLIPGMTPSEKNFFLPFITNMQGKTLKVIPFYNEFKPESDQSASSWIEGLQKKSQAKDSTLSTIVSMSFSLREIGELLNSGFFEELNSLVTEKKLECSQLNLPQLYLKSAREYSSAYIPSGMAESLSRWTKKRYSSSSGNLFGRTFYDYLNAYPMVKQLYDRIMYMSMLISQTHGADKIRKRAAQEKLWEAESGFNFICCSTGLPAPAQKIQHAFRLLNEAEKLVRESKEFREFVTSYDYNADGLNEYVCQMEKYHAIITPRGGQIAELDLVNSGSNYAANYSRIKQFDSADDSYNRGIFVEHLFENKDFDDFLDFKPIKNDCFCNSIFLEVKFDGKRRELQLESKALYSSLKVPVKLCKNYIITSNGFIVQYILKNESPFPVKGVFAVEMNFAKTDFSCKIGSSKQKEGQYGAEMIFRGSKQNIPTGTPFHAKNSAEQGGLSLLQITDNPEKTLLLFEPNEESGFLLNTINFNDRTNPESKVLDSSTLSVQFYWEIDMAPARAMEKTINLSIISQKKKNGF